MIKHLVIIIIISLAFSGCKKADNTIDVFDSTIKQNEETEKSRETYEDINASIQDIALNEKMIVEKKIDSMLFKMTLEEKVGQLFIPDLYTLSNKTETVLSDEVREKIQKYHIGGLILFKDNIKTINQSKKLIMDLQQSTNIPLFISVDEEGGIISRIAKNSDMHATNLPNSHTIGSTGKSEYAYDIGYILGRELSSLGFNMNFAPVADVNTNPQNPIIGKRSFGSDKDLVAAMVYESVRGMQDQNVSAVIKHFPGHGDTSKDTHKGSVIVNHTLERLREVEFIPFIKGIDAGVDGVMVAHIKTPNATGEDVPASLSKEIITVLLRGEIGYNGLVITDAMNMGAITSEFESGEACVKAINAGVDLLLMPVNFEEDYNTVLEAVKDKVILESRIDESVKRILSVKLKRNLFEESVQAIDPEKVLGSLEHVNIVKKILNDDKY